MILLHSTTLPVFTKRCGQSRTLTTFLWLVLAAAVSCVMFLHVLGAGIQDLQTPWFYPSDLIAWYGRALAFSTSGSDTQTWSLGFPGEMTFPASGYTSLDWLQYQSQRVLTAVLHQPVLSTNIWILSQIVLTSTVGYLFFRFLRVSSLMSFIGAVGISVAPFTVSHLANPNIAFLWPYVCAIFCCAIILSPRRGMRWVIASTCLAVMISVGGAYAFVFSCTVLFPALALRIFITRTNGARDSMLRLMVAALGVAISLTLQVVFGSNAELSVPDRIPEEVSAWQGWNISLFLPGNLSGFPWLANIGKYIYTDIYQVIDSGLLCLGGTESRDGFFSLYCRVLNERIAYPSLLTLGGAIVLTLSLVGMWGHTVRRSPPTTEAVSVTGYPALREPHTFTAFLTSSWLILLIVSSFGLGVGFAVSVPSVRAWDRIFGLAAVIACTGAILFLHSALIKIRRKSIYTCCVLAATALVLLDQGAYTLNSVSLHRTESDDYRLSARSLRQVLDPECGIRIVPDERDTNLDSSISPNYHPYADRLISLFEPSLRTTGGQSRITDRGGLRWLAASGEPTLGEAQTMLRRATQAGVCAFVLDENSESVAATAYTISALSAAASSTGYLTKEKRIGSLRILVFRNSPLDSRL